MAKKQTPQQKQTQARIARTEAYAEKVRRLFAYTVNQICEMNKRMPDIANGIMYSFDGDSKKVQNEVEMLLRQLHAVTTTAIKQGIELEWEQANAECDKLVQSCFGREVLKDPAFDAYTTHNERAMNAFISRSEHGLNLSDRVWKSVRQLRDEMEVAITVSVGEGASAQQISKRVREYLDDPDLMFRRFRYKAGVKEIKDENGNVIGEEPIYGRKWKKRIKKDDGSYGWIDYDRDSYRTGAGVYKSSAKNAMRVARTETNIAYRRADNERWSQMDFVLGQRIQLSRQHPKEDICDKLQGDYPTEFVFEGWHPQCFCFVTPILMDADEMRKARQARLRGETYVPKAKRITDYPQAFKDWVSDNKEKIVGSHDVGQDPYFVRHNYDIVQRILNPKAVEDENAFVPMKSLDELQARAKALGIRSIDLGDASLEEANVILEALHEEARIADIDLSSFKVVEQRKREYYGSVVDEGGYYNIKSNEIGIPLRSHNVTAETILSLEQQRERVERNISQLEARIASDTSKLGQNKSVDKILKKEISRNKDILSKKVQALKEIRWEIEHGKRAVASTVAAEYGTWQEQLKARVHHEVGHYVDSKLGWASDGFTDATPYTSKYGNKTSKEKFAEWYCRYRMSGEQGIPKEIVELFKKYEQQFAASGERKKTALEIAQERHQARTPEKIAEIKQRWQDRIDFNAQEQQLQSLMQKAQGLPGISVDADAIKAARKLYDVATVKSLVDEIKKKLSHVTLAAGNVSKLAADYGEVDATALNDLLSADELNYAAVQQATRKLAQDILAQKQAEQALSDVIPDVHKWHKQFSLADLQAVQQAVKSKLAAWSSLSLAEQKKKLEFEINFVADPGKYKAGAVQYPTWKVAQDAYIKRLQEVNTEIKIQDLTVEFNALSSFAHSTKSQQFKDDYVKLKAALVAKDIMTATILLADLKAKKTKLEAAASKRAAKKAAATSQAVAAKLGEPLTDDQFIEIAKRLVDKRLSGATSVKLTAKYLEIKIELQKSKVDIALVRSKLALLGDNIDDAWSQSRMDAARWHITESEANDYFFDNTNTRMQWKAASAAEKHGCWQYTAGSSYVTEPLRAIKGYYHYYKGRINETERDVENMTNLISRCYVYHDVWIKRDTADWCVEYIFGLGAGNLSSYTRNPSALVGKIGVDESFQSCGNCKNTYFGNKPCILNIYCPAGTQMIYAEPFSAFGSSHNTCSKPGKRWNGDSKPVSFGENEIILQRGCRMRITKAEYTHGKWYIDVVVLSQNPRPIKGYITESSGYYAEFY